MVTDTLKNVILAGGSTVSDVQIIETTQGVVLAVVFCVIYWWDMKCSPRSPVWVTDLWIWCPDVKTLCETGFYNSGNVLQWQLFYVLCFLFCLLFDFCPLHWHLYCTARLASVAVLVTRWVARISERVVAGRSGEGCPLNRLSKAAHCFTHRELQRDWSSWCSAERVNQSYDEKVYSRVSRCSERYHWLWNDRSHSIRRSLLWCLRAVVLWQHMLTSHLSRSFVRGLLSYCWVCWQFGICRGLSVPWSKFSSILSIQSSSSNLQSHRYSQHFQT